MKTCAYDNCGNNVFAQRLCKFHQWARTDGKAPKPLQKSSKPIARTPIKRSVTPIKKHSQNDVAKLIEKLDRLVSIYVRRKDANKDGVVKCYTCGSEKHWKVMQAGHFVPRTCMLLRFDVERNIRPQDMGCNCLKYGSLYEYGENLNKEQEGLAESLLHLSRTVHTWSKSELEEMIESFTEKIKLLP